MVFPLWLLVFAGHIDYQGRLALHSVLVSRLCPEVHLRLLPMAVTSGHGEHQAALAFSETFSRILEPSHMTIGQLTPQLIPLFLGSTPWFSWKEWEQLL